MNGIIYCYTNIINNKKYIGQTINPQQRFNAHRSAVYNIKNQEYNSPLHKAMRLYGYENFKYEILEQDIDSFEKLNELEIMYIEKYKTLVSQNGYNIKTGGNSGVYEFSEEHKRNIGLSHGKLSVEEIEYLREAYANNKSPKQIYDELYKDKMHYNSFLNIWTGQRYG